MAVVKEQRPGPHWRRFVVPSLCLYTWPSGIYDDRTGEQCVTFCIHVNNVSGLGSMDDLQGVAEDVNDVAGVMHGYL